jgi:lipid-A-disaccharide synthase-like uncharacterized protein
VNRTSLFIALAIAAVLGLGLFFAAAATLPAFPVPYEGRGHMHRVLLELDVPGVHQHWTVTGWKLLGFLGAFCFGGRWLVQAWHRKRTGRSEMPTVFWVISLAGAGMVTMYFIWGKNDSVGILTNSLPASVALYNLVQDLRQRRTT